MPAKTGAPPKLLPTCMTKDEGNLGYQPYVWPKIVAPGLALALFAIAFHFYPIPEWWTNASRMLRKKIRMIGAQLWRSYSFRCRARAAVSRRSLEEAQFEAKSVRQSNAS